MLRHEWIDKYPQVKALLQTDGEALDYTPDGEAPPVPMWDDPDDTAIPRYVQRDWFVSRGLVPAPGAAVWSAPRHGRPRGQHPDADVRPSTSIFDDPDVVVFDDLETVGEGPATIPPHVT